MVRGCGLLILPVDGSASNSLSVVTRDWIALAEPQLTEFVT
jgi:hypothetical protein